MVELGIKVTSRGPPSSAVGIAEAATAVWAPDECNRVLGQELSEEEEALHAYLVREAKGKELDSSKSFKVPRPSIAGDVGKAAVYTQ